ncbi:MAG: TrpB-like pyridoxal phosphate-dependent enzyme [bacterium]
MKKIQLDESEMPRRWYNIQGDMPNLPRPPRLPDGKPIEPEDLAPVFPMNLIEQEMSRDRWIDIPEPVLDKLSLWRPTPLVRARNLEEYLDTPAKIYFKNESVSPAGSHKPNSAVAQAYFNKEFGIEQLTTETGAGQWGSALSFACSQFGLGCKVFMVRVSYEQKPLRKGMMEVWDGECIPSPSSQTESGRRILEEDPDTPGSLGIAISEAVEKAVEDESGKTRYALGSVLNHVLLHQTVIGLETKKQLKKVGIENPDTVIGCAGGGSNFAGMAFPFVKDKIEGADMDIIPVEPSACPTLTEAPFAYDHGDEARLTPLLAMHTLGHKFVPPPIHAGGLRFHGMAPLVSQLVKDKLLVPRSADQLDCYKSGVTFARTEGLIPAPETTHAVHCAIEEAKKAREAGEEKVIVFNFSGHGMLDLSSYRAYFEGKLEDKQITGEDLRQELEYLEEHPPT